MTRRLPAPRRELLLPLAAACLVLAAFLALVAVDVSRWETTIERGDVRFATASPGAGWVAHTRAPFRTAERVLAIEDDLAFRQMLLSLRASKLRDATVSDPVLALRRADLSEELESIVARDPDPRLRSRAATLLGVLNIVSWNSTPTQGNQQDRSELLLNAIASFEQAIELNPANDDAKYNLQIMLQRGQGLLPTEASAGRQSLPGGRGARGAGAGEPGSGY